ncbi:MAG: hypothetical protein FWH21_04435 [Kiritimatiellaeota bacterium]|nr:hypothetical protein [Kiritimatiellota bacterium]
MKRLSAGKDVVLGVALSMMVVGLVFAQGTRGLTPVGAAPAAGGSGAGATEEKLRIVRFPQPGKASMIRTPVYSQNASGLQSKLSGKPREWAVFEVQYSTGAKWTDELAFNYHLMTKGKDEDGKDAYSYYTVTVRYIDIPKGNHMSCVALPPSQVERYGDPVSLALEVMGKDGTVLAAQSESTIPYPTKEWWKDSQVLDNPQVKRRNGLVDRAKTPFALINAEDYEVVQ